MQWRRVLPVTVGLCAVTVGGLVTPTADPPPPRLSVEETAIRRGETLRAALGRAQVSEAAAAAVVATLRGQVDMRRIRPGERLVVVRGREGALVGITYWTGPAEGHEIRRTGEGWRARPVQAPVDSQVVGLGGVIEASLFQSLERLGETPALGAQLVNLLEWDFDFAAEAMKGDRFRLLVEKQSVRGEFVGYGKILAAQYASVGRPVLTAVAFDVVPGKTHYFDVDGRSVRKMFLRAPLDFTRVTSGFSHARRHPILGGMRPHLAVDYAAPTGTPVRATADGVVTRAGRRGPNGLSITLRHARGYQTMYNHLSRVHVRKGQRVRQRQVIGRVGSTGLSTGPHLDYRVSKRGRFVNPLSERFAPGSPVPPIRREAFRRHRDALLVQLEREVPFQPAS